MEKLTILIIILAFLGGCATSMFQSPEAETILRKYNVPITMDAENITLPFEINGKKVPVYCFQCVIIYVSADVPKNISPSVHGSIVP